MHHEEFRRLGHAVVDRLADYFETVDDRPVAADVEPAEVMRHFQEPPPRSGKAGEEVLAELDEKLMPYCTHTGSGGYMGLITASPLPVGVLGDFIASALNQNVGVYSIGPSAVAMERETVRWLCELAGYGAGAGGNLTSGGMTANLIGLKLARDAVSSAHDSGVEGKWAVYTSEERHVSVDKAVDLVGFGREGLRAIPTDDVLRVRLDALEEALAQDKARGVRPACIVAMAGSTNTGAVDDLEALRRIADREGIWLHADAAYGGGLLVSGRFRETLRGIEQADSITIDPHKWFYAPVDAGAVLVRDAGALTRSFSIRPAYLTELDDAGERYAFYEHGLEQSRRFRALKVWMSFKRYGTDEIGRWVDANVDQARHLHALAEAHPRFASITEPPMSAACVRYLPRRELDEDSVHRLHDAVAARIERGGEFWIGTTRIKGHSWFRACPVNFRTTREHMDRLFALLERECAVLEAAR
ncbi:MAG: aspartate aminotransferase family protein [bacterium]|nr:aspartate aminotransferase family protein [bacterium]